IYRRWIRRRWTPSATSMTGGSASTFTACGSQRRLFTRDQEIRRNLGLVVEHEVAVPTSTGPTSSTRVLVGDPHRHLALAAVVPGVVRDGGDGAVADLAGDDLHAAEQIGFERGRQRRIQRDLDVLQRSAGVGRLERVADRPGPDRALAG